MIKAIVLGTSEVQYPKQWPGDLLVWDEGHSFKYSRQFQASNLAVAGGRSKKGLGVAHATEVFPMMAHAGDPTNGRVSGKSFVLGLRTIASLCLCGLWSL